MLAFFVRGWSSANGCGANFSGICNVRPSSFIAEFQIVKFIKLYFGYSLLKSEVMDECESISE